MKAAVFLERDGVLNHVEPVGRMVSPPLRRDQFRIREDVVAPLMNLKRAGYLLIATTNQPDVARGRLPRRDMDLMHEELRRTLPLDGIMVCPHEDSDECNCRKPRAGLFVEAGFRWHLDLERCFVISDKWVDAAAAYLAGCTSVLLQSPWMGSGHHDFVVGNLAQAAEKILTLSRPREVLAWQPRVA